MSKNQSRKKRSSKGNDQTRGMIFAIAGVYVIYLAYNMLQATLNGESEVSMTTTVVMVAAMALAGLAVIAYGCTLYYRARKKKTSEESDEAQSGGELPDGTQPETEQSDREQSEAEQTESEQ